MIDLIFTDSLGEQKVERLNTVEAAKLRILAVYQNNQDALNSEINTNLNLTGISGDEAREVAEFANSLTQGV